VARLQGKIAIITGASSGIGRAAAKRFAEEGASLVVTARRADALDGLVQEIEAAGGAAQAVAGDVRDPDLAGRVVAAAVDRFGGLDIAFNNVGDTGEMGPVHEVSLDGWRDTLDVNLTSAFLGAKAQIPAMLARGGGHILFTSTFVGHVLGFPGMAAYAAAKAGVVGLTRVIAAEYGAQGLRANAILPGGVDTPAGRIVVNTPEMRSFVEGLHALKRLAEPEEIADAALSLVSDDFRFMTGAAVLVDGGMTITRT
jgi:NAD(P)-dependent dehydrogenase (short-subunit alcohol dehydrogenase family)